MAFTPGPADDGGRSHLRLYGAVAIAVLLVALACAWRYTPLHALLDPPRLLALGQQVRELPFAALWTLAIFVVGGLIVMPLVALIAVTGVVWGWGPGMSLSMAGSLLSAALVYAIGRRVSGDLVQRHAGPTLQSLDARLARGGWWAVALVRLLPIAPFSVMNLLFGALRVRPRDFILGTAAGLAPGIVLTVVFASSLAQALHKPGASSLTMLGLALLLLVALAAGTRRLLARRAPTSAPEAANATATATATPPVPGLSPAPAPAASGTTLDARRSKDS